MFSFFRNLFGSNENKVTPPKNIEVKEKEKEIIIVKKVEENQKEDDVLESLYKLKMSLYSKSDKESDKKFKNLVGKSIEIIKEDLTKRYQDKKIFISDITNYGEECDIYHPRGQTIWGEKFGIVIYKDKEDKGIIIKKTHIF